MDATNAFGVPQCLVCEVFEVKEIKHVPHPVPVTKDGMRIETRRLAVCNACSERSSEDLAYDLRHRDLVGQTMYDLRDDDLSEAEKRAWASEEATRILQHEASLGCLAPQGIPQWVHALSCKDCGA